MKTLILIIAILTSLTAQSQINLSVAQDVKLATYGDDIGNDGFTSDFTFRVEAPFDFSYQSWKKPMNVKPIIYLEYEYADLIGGAYNRYNFGLGANFAEYIKKIEFQAMFGIGFINRFQETKDSFTVAGQILYRINKSIGIFAELETTKRSDLEITKLVYSGKAGIKILLWH